MHVEEEEEEEEGVDAGNDVDQIIRQMNNFQVEE